MYLQFAWRYFKAKKSAHAINIIAWVTTGIIAFATCCQILVLSVFNGFEELVTSLYSSFYTDLKVIPAQGKTFVLSPSQLQSIRTQGYIEQISCIAEEKALLQNENAQTIVQLKGVDNHYTQVNQLAGSIVKGQYQIGTKEQPMLVMGSGIQNATGISLNPAFGPEQLTVILPRKNNVASNDLLSSLSEGNIVPAGSFSIQQDFDNSYAITNIDFVKQQMHLEENEYAAVEIKLKEPSKMTESRDRLQSLLGKQYVVQTKFQQNATLYNTMKMEKWAIFALLTLIVLIAAFNMISALTMLVLEKQQDIAILRSMGTQAWQVKKIFLAEGLLLGLIGSLVGMGTATIICLLQMKYKLVPLLGGSFLIDYFPVKLIATDFLLVFTTVMAITLLASWMPASKAAKEQWALH